MTAADVELPAELLTILRRDTGRPDLEFRREPDFLAGGFWARLISFELVDPPAGWKDALVARIMPEATTAAKETAFQAAIADAGYPTPRVYTSGTPTEGIDGDAYLVMDRAGGRTLLEGLDGADALARLPSLMRRLPHVLAEALAQLHRIDPLPVIERLDASGCERPILTAMLDRMGEAAAALGREDLATASRWLLAHHPRQDLEVLCHGDLHPFNILVDDDGSTTVLDWSAAALAPAVYDLGFTSLLLAEPPVVMAKPLRPLASAAGSGLAWSFVRAYERATGGRVDRDSLRWAQGAACLRALVEVAGWVADGTVEHHRGHPWLIAGDALASRLRALTNTTVAPR